MSDEENVDLRSEKVRVIIGQVPPIILKLGNSILVFVLVCLFLLMNYFKYEYVIKTTAEITNFNESTKISIKIPANDIDKVKPGNKIIIKFDNISNLNNERIITKLDSISKTLILSHQEGYYIADVIINKELITECNLIINVLTSLEVNAEIHTDKISFFDRILKPMRLILKPSMILIINN
jgi:hypothetical protein